MSIWSIFTVPTNKMIKTKAKKKKKIMVMKLSFKNKTLTIYFNNFGYLLPKLLILKIAILNRKNIWDCWIYLQYIFAFCLRKVGTTKAQWQNNFRNVSKIVFNIIFLFLLNFVAKSNNLPVWFQALRTYRK